MPITKQYMVLLLSRTCGQQADTINSFCCFTAHECGETASFSEDGFAAWYLLSSLGLSGRRLLCRLRLFNQTDTFTIFVHLPSLGRSCPASCAAFLRRRHASMHAHRRYHPGKQAVQLSRISRKTEKTVSPSTNPRK